MNRGKKPFEDFEGFMEDESKRSLNFRLLREYFSNHFHGLRFTPPLHSQGTHSYGWDDSMKALIPNMDRVRIYSSDFFKSNK
ncbi:hypothetical protein COU59_00400 [Candidatus Pacearchaeota archaeon CG10_big_fil_rev_8_21_14_0_10_34_12]|nr:MAG: hypothetical protein COU59_00400 [Candidatus Pacearchaeota archaeon CG10_big_fil_rev_8_21_14_0_10_34_12]